MERKTFPGTLDSLADIRQVAQEEAQRVGLSKKTTYKLVLAIDEIATNIIVHGYEEAGRSGSIDVISEATDEQLMLTLEDDAEPFDPLQRDLPGEETFTRPLEERPIGGMGIFLTINGIDEFRYEFVNNRNRNIFITKVGDK
ncbi:ATP-binding protein [Larkinella harenae]